MRKATNKISDEPSPEHASIGLEDAYILATNVYNLRIRMDMSISELARASGVSRPTIYKVEKGLSDLKLSKICVLAGALGVTAQDLLTPPPDLTLPPIR